MTPSQIRQAYLSRASEQDPRYFFTRATMRFFGDTMRSYGARRINGAIYMYRKPDAYVNVFGKVQRAGRTFFNAWRFDPADADLHCCDKETTAQVWNQLFGGNDDTR